MTRRNWAGLAVSFALLVLVLVVGHGREWAAPWSWLGLATWSAGGAFGLLLSDVIRRRGGE